MPKVTRVTLTRVGIERAAPQSTPYRLRDARIPGLCLRVLPGGLKTWEVLYGRGESQRIGRHPRMTLEMARTEAQARLGEFAKSGSIVRKADTRTTLVGFLDDRYAAWARGALKRGDANVAALRATFPAFLKRTLTEITPERVARWSAARSGAGVSPATINRDVIRLKGVLTKAAEWELIATNPLKGYKLAKIDTTGVVRYLSDAERTRLHAALVKREGYIVPLVLTALGTGLRRGELTSITWADVDLDRKLLTVRAGYAKSQKARHIPLNTSTVAALKSWRDSFETVPDDDARLFEVDDPKKAWAALMTAAKIRAFRFHDMRHDFASRLAMAGVDLYTIAELLGHADLTMTKRYAHLAPEHKAAAVEKLA